ncbi:unnamed protein product [Phytophthora lilii]|uniref:Unnamed protein product n=1 Tax=Phytophthora lilii TaxID=2077276 RepID=A0A9W6U097_9STRA|nr:unnamed protein product [Phytophthora lilii]
MVAVTVGLNAFIVVMTLHGMDRRSRMARACRSFQDRPSQLQIIESRQPAVEMLAASRDVESLSTLVIATVKLLQTPGNLDSAELRGIRLLSGMPHQLTQRNADLLVALAARSVYNNERRTSRTVSMGQIKSQYATAAIEGRKLSSTHFLVPPQPRSKFFQRLRAAVVIVPIVNSQIKTRAKGGFQSSRTFRHNSRKKIIKETDSEDSNSDTFARMPSHKSVSPIAIPRVSAARKSYGSQSSQLLDTPLKQGQRRKYQPQP